MEWTGHKWPDTSVNEGLYHHHSSPQSQARGVGRSSSASRILGSVLCGDDDDAASRDDFGSVASSMRENALMMGTGSLAGKGEKRMLGHGMFGSAAAALVDDAAFGALMAEAASRPFAAERALEILNERLGRLLDGHGGSREEDEGVAELLSISLGKEVRRLKKKCIELDRRGREELAAERQRGEALAVVEMRRADLLKDAMMQEHEATKGARAALERQVRELQAMLRSQQQDAGGVSDAALRGAFEELKGQVDEDRERRAAEDEEVEAYIQALQDEVEEARQGERQAMVLVDQLRHGAKDSKGGAADGGGNQGEGEGGGEEKRVLIDELERVRLELDASEGARRELEAAVAAADQETDALRKRLADFEGELRRGEFAGPLNDRVAALEGETGRLAAELEARQARISELEHETTRHNRATSALGSPLPAGSPLSRGIMERAASAMMSYGDATHATRRSSSGNSVSGRQNADVSREAVIASSPPKLSPNGFAGRTASTPIFRRPNITSGPPRSVTPSPAGTPLSHAANQGQGGTLFERRSSLPRPRSSSFSGSPQLVRSPSSSLTSPTFSSSQKLINLTRPASPPPRLPSSSSGAGPCLSRKPSSSIQDRGEDQQTHPRLPSSHGSWVARNHREQVSRTASISSHGSNRSQVASLPSPQYRPSDSATSPGAHNISSASPLPSSSPSPSASRMSPGRRWISSGHSKTFSDLRSLHEQGGGIRSPNRRGNAMSPMSGTSAGMRHLDSWPEDRGDTQSPDSGPPSPGTDTSLDQIIKPLRRPDPIHISASTTPPRTPSASGVGSPAFAPILQRTPGGASHSSQREEGNNSGSYGELRQEIAWLKDQLSSSKGASSNLSNSSGRMMMSSDGKRRGPRTSLSISARSAGAGGGKSIAEQMRERKRSLGLA